MMKNDTMSPDERILLERVKDAHREYDRFYWDIIQNRDLDNGDETDKYGQYLMGRITAADEALISYRKGNS